MIRDDLWIKLVVLDYLCGFLSFDSVTLTTIDIQIQELDVSMCRLVCHSQYCVVWQIKFDSPYCFISIRPLVWTIACEQQAILVLCACVCVSVSVGACFICHSLSSVAYSQCHRQQIVNDSFADQQTIENNEPNQNKNKKHILRVSNVCWNFGAVIVG